MGSQSLLGKNPVSFSSACTALVSLYDFNYGRNEVIRMTDALRTDVKASKHNCWVCSWNRAGEVV